LIPIFSSSREADRVVSSDLANLLGIFNELRSELLVHPLSVTELKNDKDEKRREVNLSKYEQYSILDNPPNPASDTNYLSSIGEPKSEHDRIDNAILFCIYRNAADFLLLKIARYSKISNLGLEDRVFLVAEALVFFNRQIPLKEQIPTPPALVHDYMYNLNIDDPIFRL